MGERTSISRAWGSMSFILAVTTGLHIAWGTLTCAHKVAPIVTPHDIDTNRLAHWLSLRSVRGQAWKRSSVRRNQQFADHANDLLCKEGGVIAGRNSAISSVLPTL